MKVDDETYFDGGDSDLYMGREDDLADYNDAEADDYRNEGDCDESDYSSDDEDCGDDEDYFDE